MITVRLLYVFFYIYVLLFPCALLELRQAPHILTTLFLETVLSYGYEDYPSAHKDWYLDKACVVVHQISILHVNILSLTFDLPDEIVIEYYIITPIHLVCLTRYLDDIL